MEIFIKLLSMEIDA